MRKLLLILTATASLIMADTSRAFETSQTITATAITSLPMTINQPGNYYFPAQLVNPGTGTWAVTITANNVTLDLNGRDLLGSPGSTDWGILINGATNVTVKNGSLDSTAPKGNVASPYVYGIYLKSAVNCTVENIQITDALHPITDVNGNGNQIENCRVHTGIFGIFLSGCSGDLITGNQLSLLPPGRSSPGWSLYSQSSAGCLFQNNTVHYGDSGYGMVLSPTDQYRENAFLGFPAGSPIIYGGENIAGK
jgi:hypothetical protein